MNEQELIMQFQMFEHQINQISQQLQAVDENLEELNGLASGLEDLKGSEGKEILAPYGRGIFIKAKLLSEDLLVDIGKKNFVKKSLQETKELIQEQIQKLEGIKQELEQAMQSINSELTRIMIEAKKEKTNA